MGPFYWLLPALPLHWELRGSGAWAPAAESGCAYMYVAWCRGTLPAAYTVDTTSNGASLAASLFRAVQVWGCEGVVVVCWHCLNVVVVAEHVLCTGPAVTCATRCVCARQATRVSLASPSLHWTATDGYVWVTESMGGALLPPPPPLAGVWLLHCWDGGLMHADVRRVAQRWTRQRC